MSLSLSLVAALMSLGISGGTLAETGRDAADAVIRASDIAAVEPLDVPLGLAEDSVAITAEDDNVDAAPAEAVPAEDAEVKPDAAKADSEARAAEEFDEEFAAPAPEENEAAIGALIDRSLEAWERIHNDALKLLSELAADTQDAADETSEASIDWEAVIAAEAMAPKAESPEADPDIDLEFGLIY